MNEKTQQAEPLSEFLPTMRCTPSMKRSLEQIAANSVARNISDHVRFALERYIEEHEHDPLQV